MTTKRSLFLGSLAVAMVMSGMMALAGDTNEQSVKNNELQWMKSQQTNNYDLIAPFFADNIVETNGEGKVFNGKDAVLADAKTLIWSNVEYKDLKVTVIGRTAIATGTFVGKGTLGGKPVNSHSRFTDTWVKTADGKWQCVATHDSEIKAD